MTAQPSLLKSWALFFVVLGCVLVEYLQMQDELFFAIADD